MLIFDFTVERPKFTVVAKGRLVTGITTLVGPSGSGKSTFLKSLAGLLEPKTGYIKENDTFWFNKDTKVLLTPQARWVGYMPQGNIVFPHLSVKSNIMFSRRGDVALYQRIVERLHLDVYEQAKAGSLSGGEQQRVALGRALYARPHVLLLDEPLSALDWNLRDRVRQDLVDIIKEWQIPCLWVTHDREEALAVGNCQWQLKDGKMNSSP